MTAFLQTVWLAVRSGWSRRFVLALVVLTIALATCMLLLIERVRSDAQTHFSQAVSGTDLIVGARTGSLQLVLYSVFRIGSATNNLRWSSAQTIAGNEAVAWTVPISLGDSHRGFPVVATTMDYFEHFRYGARQPLQIKAGKPFEQLFDAVIGADVADQLGYELDQKIVLSHGDGAFEANDHGDKPFTIVGVLARTGTPVDRSIHISLAAMEAIHLDWSAGAPLPGSEVALDELNQYDLTPKQITALLVGLKNRASVFRVQREVSAYRDEPLMAVLPGVALDELWQTLQYGERALMAVTALVSLVSLISLIAVMLAGLNERRRELAILRVVGASPVRITLLLLGEGLLVTLLGVLLGAILCWVVLFLLADSALQSYGIALSFAGPTATQWLMMAAVLVCGGLASLLPAWRAYRHSLTDGLSVHA